MITCDKCGSLYPEKGAPYICECGGIFDFSSLPKFEQSQYQNEKGQWKYQSFFGFSDTNYKVSLGEGGTPLIPLEKNKMEIYAKMESHNPTGSYKDRGTSVLVSHLKSRGITTAVEDSSGNAGASFAAYCAKAEISAQVYIPESASGPKKRQIEMYGAKIEAVPGPRIEATNAVLKIVKNGATYASHAYMPFGLLGIATIAFEIVEQLGFSPASIIAPVGHGGLLYGIMLGFQVLEEAGLISSQPYYVGVQSYRCAPLVEGIERFQNNHSKVGSETIAEGVKVTTPVRGKKILERINNGRGCIVAVQEEALISAWKDLTRRGIYVEPTSALVWAALDTFTSNIFTPTVAVFTGLGYKTNLFS